MTHPRLQQRMGNRKRGRCLEPRIGIPRQRGNRLLTRHPHRILELLRINRDLVGQRLGNAGNHQLRATERPGLARDIADVGNGDACLFIQLSPDGFFNRLAGFKKAGECGIIARGKARLPPDKDLT